MGESTEPGLHFWRWAAQPAHHTAPHCCYQLTKLRPLSCLVAQDQQEQGKNTPPSQQFSAFSHGRMTQPGKGVEPPFPTCCTSCRCLQQFLLVLSGQLQWQMSSSPLCPLAVLVSIPEQLALLGCWAFYPRPFTVSGLRFSLFKEYFWLK